MRRVCCPSISIKWRMWREPLLVLLFTSTGSHLPVETGRHALRRKTQNHAYSSGSERVLEIHGRDEHSMAIRLRFAARIGHGATYESFTTRQRKFKGFVEAWVSLTVIGPQSTSERHCFSLVDMSPRQRLASSITFAWLPFSKRTILHTRCIT